MAQYSPAQPSTAQYSPIQVWTIQYSPVQPTKFHYSLVQLSTAQLKPSAFRYSLPSSLTSSHLLPYLPFQKPHSLLCLVIVVFAFCLTNVILSHTSSKLVEFYACMDYIRKSHFYVSHYPLPLYLALLRLLPPISDKNFQLDFQHENVLYPNISIFKNFEDSQQRSLVLTKLLCYKGDRFYIHGGRGHTMRKWPSSVFLSLLLISANRNTETLCLKGCRSVVSCRETYFAAVGLWLFLYITISIVNFKHWKVL